LSATFTGSLFSAEEALPDSEVLMQALVDEMERSMTLQMEDLEKPYFIAYMVDDSLNYFMSAEYGAITGFDRNRSRLFYTQVRIGSYEMDNTNFSGGGFSSGGRGRRGGGGRGRASLPLDDDYTAIRQALWWSTDSNYKSCVETLTQKRAYMEDKRLEDRPHDFAKAEAEVFIEPTSKLTFDREAWTDKLKKVSGRFKKYPRIQSSGVQLTVGATNRYLVNSEGTRIRNARPGILLRINANVQADDGMMISDMQSFYARTMNEFPDMKTILAKVDELANTLTTAMNAPIIESYAGPVLFDGIASAQLFQTMLARNLAGQVEPVGSRRSRRGGGGALERRLGQRILPDTFTVYDDPNLEKMGDTPLLGHYVYDDEGVKAQRVNLVEGGELKNMVLSRVPTKKFSGSNGHGRRGAGSGRVSAAIGSLVIEDKEGMAAEDLKAAFLKAADDMGLEYGLCIRKIKSMSMPTSQRDIMSMLRAMQRGGGSGDGPALGDPILVYKVYVEDGREELVRGCEFDEVSTRDLKTIMAAGSDPVVYNIAGGGIGGSSAASSIAAPAVLFEELELNRIEEEHDNPSILTSPLFR